MKMKCTLQSVGDSFSTHNFTIRSVSLVNPSAPITGQKKVVQGGVWRGIELPRRGLKFLESHRVVNLIVQR